MKLVPRSVAAHTGADKRHSRLIAGALLASAALAVITSSADADSLEAWGYNATGQLGNNSTANSASPVQPIGIGSVTAIAAGRGSSFAVQNGALYGWGDNGNSQLGNGGSISTTVPAPTLLTTGVTAVSTGVYFTLALQSGKLYGFGYNADGELGVGTASTVRSSMPLAVNGMGSGVTAFSAGYYHSLAVQNSAAYAWGGEYGGELGDNISSGDPNPNPTLVSGLSTGVTAVAAGYIDSFAIKGGALYSWGNNQQGAAGSWLGRYIR